MTHTYTHETDYIGNITITRSDGLGCLLQGEDADNLSAKLEGLCTEEHEQHIPSAYDEIMTKELPQ